MGSAHLPSVLAAVLAAAGCVSCISAGIISPGGVSLRMGRIGGVHEAVRPMRLRGGGLEGVGMQGDNAVTLSHGEDQADDREFTVVTQKFISNKVPTPSPPKAAATDLRPPGAYLLWLVGSYHAWSLRPAPLHAGGTPRVVPFVLAGVPESDGHPCLARQHKFCGQQRDRHRHRLPEVDA